MAQERPQDLTVNREAQTLEIVWSDGHRSLYPLAGLRNVCPCAECRGGHEGMSAPVERAAIHVKPSQTWQISGAHLVGNYALSFVWADGHDAGIYTWDFLRALCPCSQCDAEALAASAQDVYSA
ncbi:MAG: DUF971 domain-containing protein [Caldilineales bacterium]